MLSSKLEFKAMNIKELNLVNGGIICSESYNSTKDTLQSDAPEFGDVTVGIGKGIDNDVKCYP